MALEDICRSVLALDPVKTTDLVRTEVEAGSAPEVILEEGLIAAMDEVGRLFSTGVFFVPEMLMAARAVGDAMALLRPVLTVAASKDRGPFLIGTVEGDLHDIGKNLVAIMLEAGGFKVIDLGVDVPAHRFADEALHTGARVVGLSALMTATLPMLKRTVTLLKDRVPAARVIVGGAPVTPSFALGIGADGYGGDAGESVRAARRAMETGPS